MKGVLGLWSILANLIKSHSFFSLIKIKLFGENNQKKKNPTLIKNGTDSHLGFVFLSLHHLPAKLKQCWEAKLCLMWKVASAEHDSQQNFQMKRKKSPNNDAYNSLWAAIIWSQELICYANLIKLQNWRLQLWKTGRCSCHIVKTQLLKPQITLRPP